MPTTYTHYQFGDRVYPQLPEALKQAVLSHRALFDIGVHGPDPLFYYKPLQKNAIRAQGNTLHFQPAREFFTRAKYIVQHTDDPAVQEKQKAYLIGFLTHFVLDTTCHTFVEWHVLKGGVSHNKIEAEYDASLLRRAGKNPEKVDRSRLVQPSEEAARVIGPFFGLDPKSMHDVLKSQVRGLRMFYSPHGIKRALIRTATRAIAMPGDFGDLFMEEKEDLRCHASNVRLDELLKDAEARFSALWPNFIAFLEDKADLDPFFDRHFEAVRTDAGDPDPNYA